MIMDSEVNTFILSKNKQNKNSNHTPTQAVKPPLSGKESSCIIPWRLKNPSFLSNLTLCMNLIKKYMPNTVVKNEIKVKAPFPLKSCVIIIPIVMPSQNIIFQKLSLLSRTLIQFIATYIFKVYSHIIPLISTSLKGISGILLATSLFFPSSVVNAEDLKTLISSFEQQYAIPQGLLYSIAVVESQINPYAINVEGKAIISNSKASALKAIEHYRSLGHTNIDIGVMQINYRWHGKEFAGIDEMLEVNNNIEYAARLLSRLYKEHGSWHKATRLYHSATPEHHKKYSKKIIIAWLKS